VSAARLEEGVHKKEPDGEARPDPMVATSLRFVEGPFWRVRVTGPSASAHEMLKGVPTVMPAKVTSVRITLALTLARAAAARRRLLNCILTCLKGLRYRD